MPVKTPPSNESVSGLKELQARLEDLAPLPAQHEMMRWIVATQVNKNLNIKTGLTRHFKHNVDEAEAMYRNSANWRMQKGVDRILK